MLHNTLENFLETFEPQLNQYYDYLNNVEDLLLLRRKTYQNKPITELLNVEKTFVTEVCTEYYDEKKFLKIENKDNVSCLVYGYYTEDYYYDSHEITYYKTYIPMKTYEILKRFDNVKFDELKALIEQKEKELNKLKSSTYLSKEVKDTIFEENILLKNISELIEKYIEENKVNAKLLGLAIEAHKIKNSKENFDNMVEKQNTKTQVDKYIKRLKKIFDKKYELKCDRVKRVAFEKIKDEVTELNLQIFNLRNEIVTLFENAKKIQLAFI